MNKLSRPLAVALTLLVAGSVQAQLNRASLSRPSSGPSTRIGQIGGVLTRARATESAYTSAGNRTFSSPGSSISSAARFGRGFGAMRAPIPAAFDLAEVGYSRFYPGQSAYAGIGRSTTSDLMTVSRYGQSMSMSVPITGLGNQAMRLPATPYFAPEPPESAFHAFFGLSPAVEEPAPAAGAGTTKFDPAALFEERNAALLDLRMRNATAELAELLTIPNAETQDQALARAERMSQLITSLSGVRQLDRSDYLPCLMLVHLTLEKDQPVRATNYLFDVVQRNPRVFLEPPDMAKLFGSQENLERQGRRYLRIGDSTENDPAGYALQAYAAWLVRDRVRVEQALQQIDRLNSTDAHSDNAEAFRVAMAAYLQ